MVKSKYLGDIIVYLPGGALKRNDVKDTGLYPVMNGGIDYSGYYDEYNYDENVLTISHWGSSASHVHRHFKKFWANNACWIFACKDNSEYNLFFLYYYLKNMERCMMQTMCFGGATPNLSRALFEKIEVPAIPLEEQEKIVEKLDTFQKLIRKLDEEKSLRVLQYEHCLDTIFGSNIMEAENFVKADSIELKSLLDLGTLTRGKRFVREDFVESGVPCIHYGDMYTYYGLFANQTKTFITEEKSKKMRFAHKSDVVIVGAGENDWDIGVGLAWLGDEDAAVHDACYILKHQQNPKYISYFLRSNNYHLQIRGSVVSGKICSISAKDLGKAKILIPKDVKEQNAIVEKLDAFTALISKLKEERDLRQKQYEYYREKLLTFE